PRLGPTPLTRRRSRACPPGRGPVSTPPNAIIYGSGLVPLREMIRSGIYLDVAGTILIGVGLRLLCPLFGVM
ncbi:MAG: hypothetical protein ACRDH5_11640, partial [bacterium]